MSWAELSFPGRLEWRDLLLERGEKLFVISSCVGGFDGELGNLRRCQLIHLSVGETEMKVNVVVGRVTVGRGSLFLFWAPLTSPSRP